MKDLSMTMGFLGGMLHREQYGRLSAESADLDRLGAVVCHHYENDTLFLQAEGIALIHEVEGGRSFLLRGHAVAENLPGESSSRNVLEQVRESYLNQGTLPVGQLDGSFTLVVLDGVAGRVLLYRNLVGTGFTYYAQVGQGIVFSNNLAALVARFDLAARPNRERLPAFFLYRYVPGRETLFEGIFRLMPGELVCCDPHGITRQQLQTLADLEKPERLGRREAVERVDQVLGRVVAEGATRWPQLATLLSGGVDSTLLHALRVHAAPDDDRARVSFAVRVDHPRSLADTEYARTAAKALRCHHIEVPADLPYSSYLVESIAATGEPPNHVQAAYFRGLAGEMAARGCPMGLCGEAGDGLFGMGTANHIHNAGVLRAAVPSRALRGVGEHLARTLGFDRGRYYFHLAEHLYDETDLEHPVNRQAAFADWPAVESCFGGDAVTATSGYRRALLDQYGVANDPMLRLHAANFLTSSMDSSSLWATYFNLAGGDLFCPFLDSRVVRLAVSIPPRTRFAFRKPKDLLKQTLARHVGFDLAYRKKLGFGQPIFEWLSEGGQLRPLVEQIGTYEFVDGQALSAARARPSWFLYSLLCYDLWHKLFVEKIPQDELLGSPPVATTV